MFRKKISKKTYDKENLKPVIRASICTGEKVAGFADRHSGQYTEIMLIRSRKDLETFMEMYDIDENDITTQY